MSNETLTMLKDPLQVTQYQHLSADEKTLVLKAIKDGKCCFLTTDRGYIRSLIEPGDHYYCLIDPDWQPESECEFIDIEIEPGGLGYDARDRAFDLWQHKRGFRGFWCEGCRVPVDRVVEAIEGGKKVQVKRIKQAE
ncbi:MAG TPA: hypothetical protein HPP87_10135 [Planctomycetes bacterium]|nr:hypothetical protein [Planctomycetota bacterium]